MIQRRRQAAGHGGDPDHDRVGRPRSPDPRAARPAGASGHPEQPAGDLPQGGPPPAHRAGSPACWWTSSDRPRTGWCRPRCRPRPTGRSPSGRRREREDVRHRRVGPRDAAAARRTPHRERLSRRSGPNGISRRSDRTASELGYVRGAGVAGAFAGGPTRCPGIRLDVGEALGWRRSRRRPVAERGRRNQSEVSAPAMLRRTAAPTERFRNLEPDPRAAGRAAGECARTPAPRM